MAKILKEKGFNDVLPGQKLCKQCVNKYEKLTNHLKMTTWQKLLRQSSQDELASDNDFLLYQSQKKGT